MRRLRWIILATALAAVALAGQASAATPTFDGSNLAAWPSRQACAGGLTALSPGFRAHVTCDPINSTGWRAEVLQTNLRQQPGDEGYLHLRLKTRTGGSGWKINTQLHLSQGGTQPTIIIDTLSSLKIKTSTGGGHQGYVDIPLVNDHVYAISLHFKLGSAGFIEAIVDGQRFARSNRAVSSSTDTQQYWKAGQYTNEGASPDADILEWRLSPTPIGQFVDDPPPSPSAAWTGDVESGDLSQFAAAGDNDPVTPATVASDVVRAGTKALRFDIGGPETATRSYQRQFLMPAPFHDWGEGDDQWFGFSLWLDPAFPASTTHWYDLWQLWDPDGGSPPLELSPSGDRMTIGGGFGHPTGPRTDSRDAGPLVRGQWMDYVVHVKFSSDPAVGTVDAWRDGTQVISGWKPLGGTLYPGAGRSKMEFGIYREAGDPATTIRWDELRFGGSFAEVAPPGSPPPPPSPPDTTPPTAAWNAAAPADGATVAGAAVHPLVDASDASGISSVGYLVDGSPWVCATCTGPETSAPYGDGDYSTTPLTEGPHVFSAVVRDRANPANETTITRTWIVDNVPELPPSPPDPVDFTWSPATVVHLQPTTFTATGGADPNGDPVEFQWDIVHNNADPVSSYDWETRGNPVSFTYQGTGTKKVALRACDPGGLCSAVVLKTFSAS